MSQLIPNSFSSFEMTDEETLRASIFTNLQLQYLQNELAIAAEERIRLEYDPTKPLEFAQLEARSASKIEVLTYLIEMSEASNKQLNDPNFNLDQEG